MGEARLQMCAHHQARWWDPTVSSHVEAAALQHICDCSVQSNFKERRCGIFGTHVLSIGLVSNLQA